VARRRPSGRSRTSSFARHRAFARCVVEPASACSCSHSTKEEVKMILATTKVEEFDRFMEVFSTKGADKRRQHGSKGAQVFRDPNEGDRVWVLFDWDEEGW